MEGTRTPIAPSSLGYQPTRATVIWGHKAARVAKVSAQPNGVHCLALIVFAAFSQKVVLVAVKLTEFSGKANITE